jgi:hypothetical protein
VRDKLQPESSLSNRFWTLAFPGVTTFYGTINYKKKEETFEKGFPLTAGFKVKSKTPSLPRGKAKILTTPLKYSGTGIHILNISRINQP